MAQLQLVATAQSGAMATCLSCGRLSPGRPLTGTPAGRPMPALCDVHWRAVQTDWLLIGWCVDHYAEALHVCGIHGRMIEPL